MVLAQSYLHGPEGQAGKGGQEDKDVVLFFLSPLSGPPPDRRETDYTGGS